MPRLAPLDIQRLTYRQKETYQTILDGPRAKFGGPFPALIHAPEIADKIQELGSVIRFSSSLLPSLREIAILSVARYWENEVEWNAHVVIAAKEGVSPEVIKHILFQRLPAPADDSINLVLTVCDQLQSKHLIENDVYTKAIDLLGVEQVVELISVVGYFTLLSMVLNAFEVPADPKDGVPPEDMALSVLNGK